MVTQEVTPAQVVAVLEQRATGDRLIAEILRAAIIEAGALSQPEPDKDDDE